MQTSEPTSLKSGADDRLSSWKEIATYLRCGVRTVQRWEQLEGLPVHRHQHQKNGTVYAFRSELEAWRAERASSQAALAVPDAGPATDEYPESGNGSASGPAYGNGNGTSIESLPAAGHNGHQAVETVESGSLEPPVEAVFTHSEAVQEARSLHLLRYGLVLSISVAVAALIYIASERPNPSPKPPVTRNMLAVLPFANLSGNPDEDYFSDGLTEEMITELGRLDPERLGVIARTSAMKYKHTGEDIAQIGKELGVGYVLEGSVRRSQNRVRVSAQLIQVSDQTHLWAENFEGDLRNVLRVQEQLADAITKSVQVNLARGEPVEASANPRTQDVDAYDNYLKGRYFWNLRTGESFFKAIDYFNRAIQQDPHYAQAYAGLADCYTLLALYGEPVQDVMPRAKAAALKSVALNDSLPEAHTSLGAVEALWDWNWPAAERDFERAISLNPNYSPAHHWYANLYLIPQARVEEAVAEMKLAATLDPVSLIVTTDLGWSYYLAHQYDKALGQYSKALEMSPEFVPVHFRLSQYYYQIGAYDKALTHAQEAVRLDGEPDAASIDPSHATPLTREDYLKYTRQRLDDLLSGRTNFGVTPSHKSVRTLNEGYAVFYAQLGETDPAIQSLQRAVKDRNPGLIYLAVEPTFDGLRRDPRFQEIERGIGLPAR